MRHRKNPASVERVTSTCAWCGKRILPNSEIFSLGAKAKAGTKLAGPEGGVIQLSLPLAGRAVYALVPTSTSQAKKEGNDLLFALCSRECGQALKSALQQQLDFSDRYN